MNQNTVIVSGVVTSVDVRSSAAGNTYGKVKILLPATKVKPEITVEVTAFGSLAEDIATVQDRHVMAVCSLRFEEAEAKSSGNTYTRMQLILEDFGVRPTDGEEPAAKSAKTSKGKFSDEEAPW